MGPLAHSAFGNDWPKLASNFRFGKAFTGITGRWATTVEAVELDYSDLAPGIQAGEETTGWKHVARIVLGVILVIAGIAMLVLPGQGILTIIVGLNLIKPDNAIVRWIRARTPGIPEDGPIPMGAIVFGIILFIALGVVSLFYGESILNSVRDLTGI